MSLHRVGKELISGLGMREVQEMIWLRQYWKAADENLDGGLGYGKVDRLCRRSGVNRREAGCFVQGQLLF
jgi:hypothetical protein